VIAGINTVFERTDRVQRAKAQRSKAVR
jgi:hypothetical protein